MNNRLYDLNNHLFAQLERLGDESLTGAALEEEIARAKSVTQVSSQIIQNGKLVLSAVVARADSFDADFKTPRMLSGDKND